MRHVTTLLAGLALALVVAGLSLSVLTTPSFTRTLSARVSDSQGAGLSPQRTLEVAEQVRAFVTAGDAQPLPAEVDGQPGFDADAVSHLEDVRAVLAAAQVATWFLTAIVTVWLGVELVRGRLDRMASMLRAGAWWSFGLVGAAALAGLLDFDALFAWFHSLFFAEGTWTFPAGSLLIRLFPEPFWIASGAAWAVLVATGGGLLLLLAWWLDRATRERTAVKESETGE